MAEKVSVSSTRVRLPREARALPSAAVTVLLPTPPLPVTKIKRLSKRGSSIVRGFLALRAKNNRNKLATSAQWATSNISRVTPDGARGTGRSGLLVVERHPRGVNAACRLRPVCQTQRGDPGWGRLVGKDVATGV